MNSSFCAHQQGHLKGDNATHPIEPRWRLLAALLLLARRSPQRRLPCRPQSSQRLAFFALSRCARAHLEPQRSALPAHPIAAHSGASNCGFQVQRGKGHGRCTKRRSGSHTPSRHSRRAKCRGQRCRIPVICESSLSTYGAGRWRLTPKPDQGRADHGYRHQETHDHHLRAPWNAPALRQGSS